MKNYNPTNLPQVKAANNIYYDKPEQLDLRFIPFGSYNSSIIIDPSVFYDAVDSGLTDNSGLLNENN